MANGGVGCVCRVTRVVVPKQQERDTWRVSVELALVALGGWREAPAASSNKSAGERGGTLWTSNARHQPFVQNSKHPGSRRRS